MAVIGAGSSAQTRLVCEAATAAFLTEQKTTALVLLQCLYETCSR